MADHEQPLHPSRRGDIIAGKYRIEGVLGMGGMGIVFQATHLSLERLVAVKVMRAELSEYPGAVQRLVLEAKLAAQLRSEHVCKVLDVGTLDDGAPYVVMEYLEGADLATMLGEQGAFPATVAVDLLLEACEALAEAHAAHIVHRDLKPENLFVARTLDGSETVKVLDFGISKRLGPSTSISRNLTNPTAALGSPNYMPPEQMRAPKDVDARADLWAMGAILYELLTGRQAFPGDTVPEVCAAVMSSTPPSALGFRPDLPPRLVQVVERCLQKNPADRYGDVRELGAALAPFGSAKAPAALSRIERVLSGAHAPTVINSSVPPRVTPVSRPSTPRASRDRASPILTVRAPESELSSSTITTGAAVALFHDRRRRRRWLALLACAGLIAAGLVLFLRFDKDEGKPTSKPVLVAQVAPAAVPPLPRVDSPTPSSAAMTSTAAVDAGPTALAKPDGAPGAHRLAHRHAPLPSTVTGGARAVQPPPAATPAAIGAWDPNSFGPRH